jgi:hypothetical protein
MLCEICQKSDAMVHLTGWRTANRAAGGDEVRESIEHHFCERCASKEKKTNPLLNPLLRLGPSGRALKVKVIAVSAETVKVKVIKGKTEKDHGKEHFVFLRSRFPAEYAIEGMEFEMFVTNEDLERMQNMK